MSKKRPSLKGKGADIFLGNEGNNPPTNNKPNAGMPAQQQDVATSKQQTLKTAQHKATFYLPTPLLERLDETWMNMRKTNRKLKKSDIVRVALGSALDEHDKNHNDSTLSQQLNSMS